MPARRAPSLIGEGHFRFLNEDGRLSETGWDDAAREKLWRYNQHYFDDLNASGAEDRRDWQVALIRDWIAGNAPGAGSGWEPYPVSLRIVNWVKWALAGNALSPAAMASLAVQARWLTRRLERHLLGNHLFVNAKALIFAGLFFSGDEADGWRDLGFRILVREFPEQVLADGGHFELSPMYHALALEDVLDLVNICACFAPALTDKQSRQAGEWRARVPAMIRWLEAMSHPDGEIAFFNDASIGIAPAKTELLAYAARLGFSQTSPLGAFVALRDSGYYRLARGEAVLIADAAPVGPDYLPAHAHADTLSFEISLGGQRLIVNGGTSVYGGRPERLRQRGTAAHSTLVLDGRNSSEVWGGFRVARRARPFDVAASEDDHALRLSASHDGWRHLPGTPVHRRDWALAGDELRVVDEVSGTGSHAADILFHFAPGITPVRHDDGTWRLCDDETGACLATVSCGPQASAIPSSWHPEFGTGIESRCLRIAVSGTLPLRHETIFRWPQQ